MKTPKEDWTFYFDENTQTLRRYFMGSGEKWDPKQKGWTTHGCCQESACQWDRRVTRREVPFLIDGEVMKAAEEFLAKE